jgi:hypothetical protein
MRGLTLLNIDAEIPIRLLSIFGRSENADVIEVSKLPGEDNRPLRIADVRTEAEQVSSVWPPY